MQVRSRHNGRLNFIIRFYLSNRLGQMVTDPLGVLAIGLSDRGPFGRLVGLLPFLWYLPQILIVPRLFQQTRPYIVAVPLFDENTRTYIPRFGAIVEPDVLPRRIAPSHVVCQTRINARHTARQPATPHTLRPFRHRPKTIHIRIHLLDEAKIDRGETHAVIVKISPLRVPGKDHRGKTPMRISNALEIDEPQSSKLPLLRLS